MGEDTKISWNMEFGKPGESKATPMEGVILRIWRNKWRKVWEGTLTVPERGRFTTIPMASAFSSIDLAKETVEIMFRKWLETGRG